MEIFVVGRKTRKNRYFSIWGRTYTLDSNCGFIMNVASKITEN